MAQLAPLAISMGEPAGIGPDLILQLYAQRAEYELPPFVVVGSMAFLAARARRLGLNINFAQTSVAEATAQFPVALPVCHIEGLVPDKPGETSPLSGRLVMESIARAVSETLAGAIDPSPFALSRDADRGCLRWLRSPPWPRLSPRPCGLRFPPRYDRKSRRRHLQASDRRSTSRSMKSP